MNQPPIQQIETQIQQFKQSFEPKFISLIQKIFEQESVVELRLPVLYSLKAGGKRFRPFLLYLCADVQQNPTDEVFLTSAALECIHTYSLIHDDLPSMDNDDLRRGQLSCHKQFPEWAAVLAGDTLNTFAFRLIADSKGNIGQKLRILSDASGHKGMAAGQALDLASEKGDFQLSNHDQLNEHLTLNKLKPNELSINYFDSKIKYLFSDLENTELGKKLLSIHSLKTGALIQAACELGAICANKIIDQFSGFGLGLGLLFQITDDLLDVEGNSALTGKLTGKDSDLGKLTFPSLLGLTESRRLAESLSSLLKSKTELMPLSNSSKTSLSQLVDYVLYRDH